MLGSCIPSDLWEQFRKDLFLFHDYGSVPNDARSIKVWLGELGVMEIKWSLLSPDLNLSKHFGIN